MAKEKRYYWMRLPKDFFSSRAMKKLRKIAGGEIYTIIYLKMQLYCIDKGAIIKFEGTEKTIAEQISLEIDEDVDNIQVTINFLIANDLIEIINDDDLLLTETEKLIGSESQITVRTREYRKRQKLIESEEESFQSNAIGTQPEHEQNTEKEKELELEIKKDINTLVDESTCKQSKTERIEEMYLEFRKAYPKKQGSKTRVIKYYKLFKDKEATHKLILEDLEKRKGCIDWIKDNGQYIPNFDTYIYNERWLDEYETTLLSDGIQKAEGLPDWYLNDEPETEQQNEQTDKDLQEALAMLGGSE